MKKDKKKIPTAENGILRIFELITESMGWLQIVAAPLLIGLVVAAIIYYPNPTTTRLVLGIFAAALGLIVGIIWATKQWKGKGTIWLISRTMSTPELDKQEEVIEPNTTIKGE
jgi:hypothetical protein